MNAQAVTLSRLQNKVAGIHDLELERDRLRYAANVAMTNADKKLGHHGQALADTRSQVDTMAGQLQAAMADKALLAGQLSAAETAMATANEQVATTQSLAVAKDRQLASYQNQLATLQRELTELRAMAGDRRTLTMSTQTYQVFFALLGRYRKDRAGVDLTDYDYALYQHANEFSGRRKTNTTEIDTRTLYYFTQLTTIAASRSKKTGYQDTLTKNAILLYNAISKLIPLPKTVAYKLTKVDLPAQGLENVKL